MNKERAIQRLAAENGLTGEIKRDENLFEIDGEEYLVLSEEEADKQVKEYIRETLWAFNSDFIISYMQTGGLTGNESKALTKSISEMQNALCEKCNDIIYSLIYSNYDEFVADAISADGRGNYLSSYDGKEEEIIVDGERFYIYRQN